MTDPTPREKLEAMRQSLQTYYGAGSELRELLLEQLDRIDREVVTPLETENARLVSLIEVHAMSALCPACSDLRRKRMASRGKLTSFQQLEAEIARLREALREIVDTPRLHHSDLKAIARAALKETK